MDNQKALMIEKTVAELKATFMSEKLMKCAAFMEQAEEFIKNGKENGYYLRACRDVEDSLARNGMI